jgi:hypothetical protein
MARFLDHHTMPAMSAEQMKKLTEQIKAMIDSKKPDSFGVTQLNVFMAPGEAWGYSDAPNAEAVVKSHASLGIKITVKDVIQVSPVA